MYLFKNELNHKQFEKKDVCDLRAPSSGALWWKHWHACVNAQQYSFHWFLRSTVFCNESRMTRKGHISVSVKCNIC